MALRYWPHDGTFENFTCRYPFERIEILPRGEVYTCCSAHIKHNYYIGNLYDAHESFDEIWNSDKAKKLRYSVYEGNFEFCQKNCKFFHMLSGIDNPIIPKKMASSYGDWKKFTVETAPKYIALSCDESCNLHCPSCRSEAKALDKTESDRLYDRLMKIVRPMLKGCKLLVALGSGDIFASSAVSRFLKTVNAQEFPQLKLDLITNLQLLDEKKWEEFSNLLEIPKKMRISVDGASKETYEENRRGGTWARLQKNLAYLCGLKENGEAYIDWIGLNFVVQANNYREIPMFVNMAKMFNVDAVEFQKLANWGTFSEREYKKRDVLNIDNPHYETVVKILQEVLKESSEIEIIQNII